MGNPISKNMAIGTIGELLVQTRLLQYGVQAAPPIKDSGNDLIAVKGEIFKGIQVKTTSNGIPHWHNLPDHYHILAIVKLDGYDDELLLDSSIVYLIPRGEVDNVRPRNGSIEPFRLCQGLVEHLFNE